MSVDESGKIQEIHRLLAKIDKDSRRIAELETALEESREERDRLLKTNEQLKIESKTRNRQQSLMIRERDHAVRDISTELSQVSTKLKKKEEAQSEQQRLIRRLKDDLYRSESKLVETNMKLHRKIAKIESLNKENTLLRSEKSELERLVGMYDELKSQIKFEEVQRQRERKKVLEKAQSLFKSVIEVKEDLTKSEAFLKESLSKSQEKGLREAQKSQRSKASNSSDEMLKLRQAKVGLLNAQNAFLKKKVFKLLNQYFLRDSQQLAEQEVPKRTSAFQQNLSECSISGSNIDQTQTKLEPIKHPDQLHPNTPRTLPTPGMDLLDPKIISQSPIDRDFRIPSVNLGHSGLSESIVVSVPVGNLGEINSRKTSIVDSSHVIGGVTYHMLRNTRAQQFGDISTECKFFFIF